MSIHWENFQYYLLQDDNIAIIHIVHFNVATFYIIMLNIAIFYIGQ